MANWMNASGRLVGQTQLSRTRLPLVSSSGLTDSTSLNAAEGLFLVRAESDADAQDLARSSPYLRYGGHIAVRRRAGR